jgi:hypothetical protein
VSPQIERVVLRGYIANTPPQKIDMEISQSYLEYYSKQPSVWTRWGFIIPMIGLVVGVFLLMSTFIAETHWSVSALGAVAVIGSLSYNFFGSDYTLKLLGPPF